MAEHTGRARITRKPLLTDRYRQPAFVTDRTSHLLIACEAYQRRRIQNPNKRIGALRKILGPMLSKADHPIQGMDRPARSLEEKSRRGTQQLRSSPPARLRGLGARTSELPLDQRATLHAGHPVSTIRVRSHGGDKKRDRRTHAIRNENTPLGKTGQSTTEPTRRTKIV